MPLPTSAGSSTGKPPKKRGGGGAPSWADQINNSSYVADQPSSSSGGNILQQISDIVASTGTSLASQVETPTFDVNLVQHAQENLEEAKDNAASATTESLAAAYTGQNQPTPLGGGNLQAWESYYERQANEKPKSAQEILSGAETQLSDAMRAERMRAIGADVQGPHAPGQPAPGQHGKVEQMTQEAYDALNDKQRAAVDFNTMLVQAVRRDNRLQEDYKPTEVQRDTYDAAVEKMFGEDRGSILFAPETMAVLKQIEFKDPQADLDDFLGLNAAITQRDLRHLDNIEGPTIREATINPVQLDRYQLTDTLATGTQQAMQDVLARGNAMLSTSVKTLAYDRLEDIDQFLGGQAKPPKPGLVGYGTGEADTYFQTAFDALARKENKGDTDKILAAVGNQLSPADFDAFLTYAGTRSENAARYSLDLGAEEGVKYQSPEDFRKILGLDKGGPDAA